MIAQRPEASSRQEAPPPAMATAAQACQFRTKWGGKGGKRWGKGARTHREAEELLDIDEKPESRKNGLGQLQW